MAGLTHAFTWKLPVTAERAFAALTQPAELKAWFADHVEVEPHAGGAFRFWGKHTYGTPTRADATQQVLRWSAPHALAYTWTLHGRPSEVSLTIEPDPADATAAVVKGTHAFAELPAIGRAKEMVDDLWRLHHGNLLSHLRGGSGLLLPDYTDKAPDIRLSILIDAPRERVFHALLDPALLNKWVASAAVVEPRVGGRYSFGWSYQHGGVPVEGGPTRILELVENEKLVVDWPDWRGDASVPVQKITWLLESAGGAGAQTRVTLIHSGFVRAVDISDYPFGWGDFAARLKAVAEGKEVPAGPGGCG
jgi:uncharacterized protein YndB with AHSA1/START domain